MFGQSLSLRRPSWLVSAPGRNTSVGAVPSAGAGRGRGKGKDQQPEAEGEPKQPPPPPRRLSKLFEKYQADDLEQQQEEALEYSKSRFAAAAEIPATRNGRPRARTAKAKEFVQGSIALAKKRAEMFTFNVQRNEDEANIGVYGKGKMCWWALRVNPGREKQVADAIDRLLEYLPPVRINGVDKPEITREAECWVPQKKVRAWSPKTGKMGNKSLKYDDGGFLLVKTVMDKAFVTMMAGNINVLGFQDREVYEGVEFPRPASEELLKTVRDWEADLSDVTEEQINAQIGVEKITLPATSEPSLEEFFYDYDVEASVAAVEEREARRAERGGGRFGSSTRGGGRFGGGRYGEERGRGRGERGRGARGRGRSGFFPGDNDSYDSRRRDDGDSRTGDGWDRPPRRQQQQRDSDDFAGTGGSDWYDGGSGALSSSDDAAGSSGWFTGAAGASGGGGSGGDALDDDIGWFGADSRDTTQRNEEKGGGGGLLSDDDDEFWSPPKEEKKEKRGAQAQPAADASAPIDDLDAIWGAGMGGGDTDSLGSGWMAMESPETAGPGYNNSSRERGGGDREPRFDRGERSERGERGGRDDRSSGGRFDRGDRGGRDREFNRRSSSFSRDNNINENYRDSRESKENRFSGGDDLSWWDAAPGETSGGGGSGSTSSSSPAAAPPATQSAGKQEESSNWNDGDDWFSDDFDADFSGSKGKSSKTSSGTTSTAKNSDGGGSSGNGEDAAAAAPPLSAGTKVEVVSGRFQDFEGVIVESNGERVKAELDVFGTPTVVEISRGEVEPF